MQLKRIKITIEDKTDYSGKSKDEIQEALTEMEQECINRIIQGVIGKGLVLYEIEETEGHGYRATATLGVYDIRDTPMIPEEKA